MNSAVISGASIRAGVAVLTGALALPAAPETSRGRAEITVYAGASVAEVEGDSSPLFPAGLPAFYEQRSRVGGSALVGLRLTRYVGERAAVELDLAVAPSQQAEYEARVVCRPGQPCPRAGVVCRPDRPCATPPFPGLVPEFFLEDQLTSWQYALGFTYDLGDSATRPYLGAALGGATYTGLDGSRTDVRFGLLAGLKLGSGPLRARLELGDFVTTSHFFTGRTEHDLQVRAGLSVRLP